MASEKECIAGLIREMLPDITVHILLPHERLSSLGSALQDAYGKEAVLLMEIQQMRLATSQNVATMMRIPLADEALNVLLYNPRKIDRHVPYNETYVIAHEAAHAGIDRLIDVDGAIRRSFPDCGRMRTIARDLETLSQELEPLADRSVRLAIQGRVLSETDAARMTELERQVRQLEGLMDGWEQFRLPFINQHTLAYLQSKGTTISEADIPAFKERVCDLFASVEAARRTPGHTPQQVFEARADAMIINTLQNAPWSTKSAELRQSILEHYSADVLDAAARQPEVFESLSGYKLLEACIVFAGRHFKPSHEIGAVLQRASDKGLMVNSRRGSSSLAAGKILFTTPAADPLSALASRFAKAHFRECERRQPLLRTSPQATARNNIIKRYYAALMWRGKMPN